MLLQTHPRKGQGFRKHSTHIDLIAMLIVLWEEQGEGATRRLPPIHLPPGCSLGKAEGAQVQLGPEDICSCCLDLQARKWYVWLAGQPGPPDLVG